MNCIPATAARVSAVLLVWLIVLGDAAAYTPQSPEVQQLVERAVRFLEGNASGSLHSGKLGGACLTGLAVYKHRRDGNHPLVREAINKCRQVSSRGVDYIASTRFQVAGDGGNYSLGIALLFLCELDSVQFRSEIEILLQGLLNRQQPGGGWSYYNYKTGDTSQTQYAVLGAWIAGRSNFPVPQDSIERVCGWLIRTQAPDGGWGYQGNDPGTFGRRVAQAQQRPSLAAAGLSSAYICAEMLGYIRGPETRNTAESRLPAALREVGVRRRREPRRTEAIPANLIRGTLRDGNQWFARNFNIVTGEHQHYYLYGFERYMSFRDFVEGASNPEPVWYNQGVEFLGSTQADDGSWASSYGKVVDTGFSILFLLRSTQDAIGKVMQDGRLRGGKLLPADVSQIVVDQGQIVSTKETPPVNELIDLLENIGASSVDTSIPERLQLSKDSRERASQVARLKRMAMSGPYQGRLTAVKTLGRVRDLDHVPVLIFALGDPDPRVARAARDGLRFVSRRVDGFGLRQSPTEDEVNDAQAKWKRWYFEVRPDGALIE